MSTLDTDQDFNQPLHVADVNSQSAFNSMDGKALHGAGVAQVIMKLIEDTHIGTAS